MSDKIFTVRPSNEDHGDSVKAIHDELKDAGLTVEGITRGITEPNGQTIYWVYVSS